MPLISINIPSLFSFLGGDVHEGKVLSKHTNEFLNEFL
jgi:hypothetical protein